MGFYGNITNTAKTTFSFDLVYESRFRMEEANKVNSDGVFLGRYVLVDYDTDVIEAYYTRPENSPNAKYMFYNIPLPDRNTQPLTPQIGVVYQTKNQYAENNLPHFYKWDPKYDAGDGSDLGGYILISDGELTKYTIRFRDDVSTYGRGYDSTVWMKTYDDVSKSYKYVMIAELNAAVPTFHLINHPPTVVPTTPYFDRDTTNLDYYLNMASNYGFKLDSIEDEGNNNTKYSDQLIDREKITYTVDNTGYQSWSSSIEEDTKADIFYNKDGFKSDKHTYIKDSQLANSIGYRLTESGRHYGSLPYVQPYTAMDTFSWHLRLPVLGNAICEMWDRFYGNRATDNKRYLNFAQKRKDRDKDLVTYDQDTVIGIINTARDMLGYYYIPLSELGEVQEGDSVGPEAIETTVTHTIVHSKGSIRNTTIKYPILQCLYYDDNNYYHYAYTPTYEPYDNKLELEAGVTYYYKTDEGIYRVANPEARKYNDANHEEQTLQFWKKIDGWTLKKIIPDDTFENSIYGLITEIHKLLGTNVGDTRDYGSIQGSINIIKDIVESLELKPDRLVCTNEKGQLTTHDSTYFPSATWDRDEVLNGNGDWVSRFATIKVLKNSTNDDQKTFKVNDATSGEEAGTGIVTITSDNNKDENGKRPTKKAERHSPNNLTLGTRNKWIQLHADNQDDSIEFRHLESPIIGRLRAEQAVGTTDNSLPIYVNKNTDNNGNVNLKTKDELIAENANFDSFSVNENATEITVKPTTDNLEYKSNESDQNDNRLTIPYLTVDNAGHVVELGTKNFNIPHGFKKIYTTTAKDTTESPSSDKSGYSIAENIADILTLAPQNRWIDIATTENNDAEGSAEDKITFGHRLINDLTKVNDKIENADGTLVDKLNGSRRSDSAKIPTVYRFGLPQDKSISDLDSQFGGYDESGKKITDTTLMRENANTFNVPYIEIDKAGHVVAAETHTVEIPENYTTIEVGSASTSTGTGSTTGTEGATFDSLAGKKTLTAKTLTETLTFKPSNKWIRLKGTDTDGSDTITIGHEIHNIIETTHSEDLDLITDTTNDTRTQKATFDTQTVRWDNAGHITGYDIKTWTLPDSFHNIVVGEASTETENGTSGKGTLIADTTFDSFSITPSNTWIRLKGDPENDNIDIGHLVQSISTTAPTTDLNTSGTFQTEEYTYDEAGHIRSKATRTLTLPYNYKKFTVGQSSDTTAITTNTSSITAQNQADTMKFAAGNKWIQLAATNSNTSGKDTITIAHSVQGTAGSYTGDDLNFTEFGGEVTIYGYETDNAGHIINNPTYKLKLPEGSYNNSSSTKASNVITGMSFDSKTGAITTTSENVGTLVLTGYTKLDTTTTAAITATNTINEAFAALDNRIAIEENARAALKMFKIIKVGTTKLEADTATDTLTITAGNDGIILTPTTSTSSESFTIGHKDGEAVTSGFYKFSTDDYGHVSTTTAVTIKDLTDLGAATAENLTAHTNDQKNPHKVTKAQVGLGNVTNESKTTMFTDPSFTGSATVDGKSIATTDYIQSILSAFNITLKDFTVNVSPASGVINTTLTATIDDDNNTEASYAYQWYKQNTGSTSWTKISSTSTTYKPTAAGSYRCTVTKTCCGIKKAVNSATVTITAS